MFSNYNKTISPTRQHPGLENIKCAELSYELDYSILFWSWILLWKYPHFMEIFTSRGYYPHLVEISMFCGHYLHFVDISALHGYYSHFVEISTLCGYYPNFVNICAFHGYYPHFVDTICIDHITSYLDHNVCDVLNSFVLVVDIIFVHITSYLSRNFRPISHILLI